MESIYRKIQSLDFRYEITRDGIIRNIKSKKKLTPRVNQNGYLQVNCNVNKSNPRHKPYGYVTCQIHKLVMEAWGPHIPTDEKTPKGYPIWVIDHKDRNKRNNDISNLRWTSWSENSKNTSRSYAYLSKHPNYHRFRFVVTEKATGSVHSFFRYCEVEAYITAAYPFASRGAIRTGVYRGYTHGFCIKKIPLNA